MCEQRNNLFVFCVIWCFCNILHVSFCRLLWFNMAFENYVDTCNSNWFIHFNHCIWYFVVWLSQFIYSPIRHLGCLLFVTSCCSKTICRGLSWVTCPVCVSLISWDFCLPFLLFWDSVTVLLPIFWLKRELVCLKVFLQSHLIGTLGRCGTPGWRPFLSGCRKAAPSAFLQASRAAFREPSVVVSPDAFSGAVPFPLGAYSLCRTVSKLRLICLEMCLLLLFLNLL